MPKNSRERAQSAHNSIERQAGESHRDFERRAALTHSTFESNNQSVLGSGQSSVKKNPTDLPVASGETTMVSLYTVTTVLGSLAAAAILGRRGRGNN